MLVWPERDSRLKTCRCGQGRWRVREYSKVCVQFRPCCGSAMGAWKMCVCVGWAAPVGYFVRPGCPVRPACKPPTRMSAGLPLAQPNLDPWLLHLAFQFFWPSSGCFLLKSPRHTHGYYRHHHQGFLAPFSTLVRTSSARTQVSDDTRVCAGCGCRSSNHAVPEAAGTIRIIRRQGWHGSRSRFELEEAKAGACAYRSLHRDPDRSILC